ncbi:MAG: type I-E CRISPR-associated protein Cse2/CasB [Hyphomicrobiales bacterium]
MTSPAPTQSASDLKRQALERGALGLLAHLQSCVPDAGRKGDPGSLAALRRALGKRPAEAIEACRVVERHVPELPGVRLTEPEHEAFYIIGGLFALHPRDFRSQERYDQRSLGASLRSIRWRDEAHQEEDDGVERRFIAVLEAAHEALPTHLRALITFFSSRSDQPIDYLQLFKDLLDWDHPDRGVQRRWAAGFWRQPAKSGTESDDADAAGDAADSQDDTDNK